MNLLTTKGRLLTLTILMGFAGQVPALCPASSSTNNATSSRGSIAAHVLELGCSREASIHASAPSGASTENHPDFGANRWSMAAVVSAANVVSDHTRLGEVKSPVERSLSEVHWADSHDWINNPPEWVKAARNYKRQGMPILHLMQSKDTLVALGVSNHGKPGLYFTRKVGF